jgi:hypothetical protein
VRVLIQRGAQQGHFRHGTVYRIMRFGVGLVLKIIGMFGIFVNQKYFKNVNVFGDNVFIS